MRAFVIVPCTIDYKRIIKCTFDMSISYAMPTLINYDANEYGGWPGARSGVS